MAAVVFLPQLLPVFEQQDLVHLLFFLVLPVSAKLIPVIKKAAVANRNTFFICVNYLVERI